MSTSILKLLETASEAYYDGSPIISNEEYDALERMYGQIIGGHGEVEHMFPMYSLQKHYADDGEPPLNVKDCIETPKFDGAAVSLLYVDGHLAKALTRGNGKKGRDITEKLSHLVPPHIVSKKPTQITGEVVALKTVENSRNYASGALNLKNIEEFKERTKEGEMIFIAYGTSDMSSQYFHDMDNLSREGFYTCLSYELSKLYPTDGKVFRVNKNDKFLELGYTAKFPRGAFAWKENQEAVVTRLIDVIWNTGKSGKVTPTAILEPVVIGEATVGRATLNNIAYIEALDLEIGCMVEVIRSGEIIPKIIGRAD